MEWLGTAFLAANYLLAFGLAAGLVLVAAVGAAKPLWATIPYWLVIFYFPNASWGLVDVDPSKNIYTRGAGQLFFSLLNIYLFALALMVFMGRRFGALHKPPKVIGFYSVSFGLIFLVNIPVGLYLDHSIFRLLHQSGLIHLMNMFLACYVVARSIKSSTDLDLFVKVFLFAAITRGIWGLIRFAFLGGDPANFYANFQRIDVRITFFDINDGAVATAAAFILAWRLLYQDLSTKPWEKILTFAALLLELFIVVFSFRRTGWIGFALAALVFAFAQPAARRTTLLLLYAGAGVPLIIYQTISRMASSALMADAGLLEKLAPDIFAQGQVTAKSGRFVELYAAWHSIAEYPVFGLGLWGAYRGEGIPDLAFHKGDFTWMHSGVLHVWLKSGFVGVLLLLGLWFSYGRFVIRSAKALGPADRGLLLAFSAGLLFYLPTWLVGTPVIEYRTMQLNGAFLALPLAVWAVTQMRANKGMA